MNSTAVLYQHVPCSSTAVCSDYVCKLNVCKYLPVLYLNTLSQHVLARSSTVLYRRVMHDLSQQFISTVYLNTY